jgi:serine/threonine protein kinase
MDPKKNKLYYPRKLKTNNFQERKVDGSWFTVKKHIGKGKYGKVYLVRDKETGFILALKTIEKKKLLESNLLDQFIR